MCTYTVGAGNAGTDTATVAIATTGVQDGCCIYLLLVVG